MNMRNVKNWITVMLVAIICQPFLACPSSAAGKDRVIIFNAGSLSIPLKEMSEAFNKKYPQVQVQKEAAGSRVCARKITDLKLPCDIMASADYAVIDDLLIPSHAAYNIQFATNEMAIMYRPDSKFAKEINGRNWYKILLRKGVEYGHSDPNADPAGYRSQLVWQLAEKYYQVPGLYHRLTAACPVQNVRPKETDLIPLLQAGQIDYLFIYRSVCLQHHMPYVSLPAEINLGSQKYADFYKQATLKISGKKPGTFIEVKGAPMVYGLTLIKNAPDPEWGAKFVAFILGPEGRAIMEKNGQGSINPPVVTGDLSQLPPALKFLAK